MKKRLNGAVFAAQAPFYAQSRAQKRIFMHKAVATGRA